MTSKDAQKPQNDESACYDAETKREPSKANSYWIVAINIIRLGGPEKEDREEICSRDESDKEC